MFADPVQTQGLLEPATRGAPGRPPGPAWRRLVPTLGSHDPPPPDVPENTTGRPHRCVTQLQEGAVATATTTVPSGLWFLQNRDNLTTGQHVSLRHHVDSDVSTGRFLSLDAPPEPKLGTGSKVRESASSGFCP